VRTTPPVISIASKMFSRDPSQSEPPRGTTASPNTVMTIDHVRDGLFRRYFNMGMMGEGDAAAATMAIALAGAAQSPAGSAAAQSFPAGFALDFFHYGINPCHHAAQMGSATLAG